MQLSLSSGLTTLFVALVLGVALSSSSDEQPLQTLLTNAPSLLLRVTLGGNALSIQGQAAFDIVAIPVVSRDNGTIRYDGFTSIVQNDTEFTYMLVDGAGYVVTKFGNDNTSAQEVRCTASVSPFDLILPALNTASVTSSFTLRGETIECPGGSTLQTSFGGMDFSLCALGKAGATVLGSLSGTKEDMAVGIDYLSSPIKRFSAPTLSDRRAKCPVLMKPTSVTAATLALLTGDAIQPNAMHPEI